MGTKTEHLININVYGMLGESVAQEYFLRFGIQENILPTNNSLVVSTVKAPTQNLYLLLESPKNHTIGFQNRIRFMSDLKQLKPLA